VLHIKKGIPPNFWQLKSDGSGGNNDNSVGVMKVIMVKNCAWKWLPKIPPPPELKKTPFAFSSVRPLEKCRLSGFIKLTCQILGVAF